MEKEKEEEIVMNLITNSGIARSNAMEAIQLARRGDFTAADAKLAASRSSLSQAHHIQTQLLEHEADGALLGGTSLIMVHAQDHVMNAMTVSELATEIVALCRAMGGKGEVRS
jgi:PTS system cellobiose-specific IIA component